jgi:hypothetical protein
MTIEVFVALKIEEGKKITMPKRRKNLYLDLYRNVRKRHSSRCKKGLT